VTRKLQLGFSLLEMMAALLVLLVVAGIVMSGMSQMMNSQNQIANRTEMHAGVRSATELLQQEIGQAGIFARCAECQRNSACRRGCKPNDRRVVLARRFHGLRQRVSD